MFVRGGSVKIDSVVKSSEPVLSIDDFVVCAHLIFLIANASSKTLSESLLSA
jgi:hypothetical protein